MEKLYYLMRLYHSLGKALADLQPLLGRKPKTLKKHARFLGLTFEDYAPRTSKSPAEKEVKP